MKKLLFFILIASMVSTVASAESFVVDSITYEPTYTHDDNTVMVVRGPYFESVEIPATVFYDNVTYKVEAIGYEAFQDRKVLTSVTIAEGVERIASSAFSGCTNLTSIYLPSSMTSIRNMAFKNCEKLNDVIIPSGVTEIGQGTFQNCCSLTSIIIPEGVTSIGEYSFQGCTSLKSITFGNGFMDIAVGAFDKCSSVASVTFLGVMPLKEVFKGVGSTESPATLKIPSSWPANDKPVNSSTPWHGGYFNCEYVDPVKEFLGEMGEPCDDCPHIEVTKGNKTIKLYNPDKVEFKKG